MKIHLQHIQGPGFEDGNELSAKKWMPLPTSSPPRLIASGLAVLEDDRHSIALDPKVLFPYSRKDVQRYLNVIFWLHAVFSITTGVLLRFNQLGGVPWSVAQGGTLISQGVNNLKWALESRRKAQMLRHENNAELEGMQWMAHPAGTRAPPPSFDEDRPPRNRGDLGDDWY